MLQTLHVLKSVLKSVPMNQQYTRQLEGSGQHLNCILASYSLFHCNLIPLTSDLY